MLLQVKTSLICLFLVAISAATLARSESLAYLSSDEYARSEGSSSLPGRFGERVVRDPSPGRLAAIRAVAFLFDKPYESVRNAVRRRVQQRFGESSFREDIHQDVVEWNSFTNNDADEYDKERHKRFQSELKAEGIDIAEYRESRIETKKYNVRFWRDSSSTTEYRVIDVSEAFHLPWSIVVISRRDRELDAGFFHNSLVPFLGSLEKLLVTDTELEVVTQAAKELSGKEAAFPLYEFSLLANAERIVKAKRDLSSK